MTNEINSGILIIGVSSTVLFDGETSTTELILLNLATGVDFSLPVSDEQAGHVMAHLEPMIPEDESAGPAPEEAQPSNISALAGLVDQQSAEAFARKIGVGMGGADGSGNPPQEADETPQF